MTNPILDKIPQALKSLNKLENELRSALLNGAVLRAQEASQHLAEARRQLEDILNTAQQDSPNPPEPTRADDATPKKEGDV